MISAADSGAKRGSALLLVGRIISKTINFGIQVAIVRLLTKDDFGAFAYGLALVGAGEVAVKLGIGAAADRFVPFYYEHQEFGKLLGTLVLVTGCVILLSLVGYLVLLWVASLNLAGFPSDTGALVVLTLALLAPINALDQVCVQTLACFGKSKQIFVRKHLLGPSFRWFAVALTYSMGAASDVLAMAYLVAGLIGVLLCLHLVIRELYLQKVLPRTLSDLTIPWRQLFTYSVPLISSDLVPITLTGVTTIVLMAAGGEAEIATMRAVAPAAALNLLVLQSFAILYLPHAARLFAREDTAGLARHHWETAALVAVLSFPIFGLTFSIAPNLVPLLFGEEYSEASSVLAILSLGTYLGIALGFSSQSLQVSNKTGVLAISNIFVISVAILFGVLLSDPMGAMGAAIAVSAARIGGAGLRHWYLLRTKIVGRPPAYMSAIWLSLVIATILTGLIGWVWQPPLFIQLGSIILTAIYIVRVNAHALKVEQAFPELLQFPYLPKLLNLGSK